MIYTQQRRRMLNKAVRSMFPDTEFYESTDGVPVMECQTLPEGSYQVINPEEFINTVKEKCMRTNEMGTYIPDYSKTLPVFIHSLRCEGRDVRDFYRVNYVSISEGSLQKAAEYIARGKLYAV